MNSDIIVRQNQITRLHNYLKDVDTEVTMILQNLQWDRKHLAEQRTWATCQYEKSHTVPLNKLVEHENKCCLKSQGYIEGDRLLPSPLDPDATTLIKLNGDNIAEIINTSCSQPSRGTGVGCSGHQPLTLERLQATYTAEERRAIHDVVINQVPSCHDLSDLALLSSNNDVGKESKAKSKLEILAELRDMRRRRTKYRVAAKTRNYSDVLRDVITSQMELYTQAHNSMSHMFITKNNDPDGDRKATVTPKDKYSIKYSDVTSSKSYHSNAGQISSSTKDACMSRHSKQHEEYEIRKRRHNESEHVYNSTSVLSRTDRCTDNYIESKRRNNGNNSAIAHKKSHKYHPHKSRNSHNEKEYNRKEKSRNIEHSVSNTEDQTKSRHSDYSKFKEYYINKRQHSDRKRNDYDRHRRLSPKSKDETDRQKRYEYKRKQKKIPITKKEKDDYYDDDSTNSGNNETEYINVSSHNCQTHYFSVKKVKVEEDYLKREGNGTRDGFVKDYGSTSSDTFNRCQQSEIVCGRYSNSFTYKDKHKYKQKNKDKIHYNNIQQQECRETAIHKIKLEKDDAVYEEQLDTNKGTEAQHLGAALNDQYKKRDGKYESSPDKYGKHKKKEKTYRNS